MAAHEFMGLTFDRNAIAGVVAEIERQKAAKRDLIYPVEKLSYTDEGKLVFSGTDRTFDVDGRLYLTWQDAELAAEEASKCDRPNTITPKAGVGAMPLSRTASSQLLGRLEVPVKFADNLVGREYNDLLGDLIRGILSRQAGKRFLVRTLDGRVRAVLSDKYKALDNSDLFFCAATKFKEVGAQLWKARLWDGGFEMFGVAPHIEAQVTTDRTFDPGDGWQSRWYGSSGDVHNAAVRLDNSETGQGGLNVKLAIMRRVCANFNVWADGVSVIHAGKTNSADDGLITKSDETRRLESAIIWSKVNDAITTAFDATKFTAYIAALNNATQQPLTDARVVVANVSEEYGITDERKASILADLLGSGDLSRFGLCQSITSAAHVADKDGRAEEASQLETLGGEIITMSDSKFAGLMVAA